MLSVPCPVFVNIFKDNKDAYSVDNFADINKL